MKLHSVRAAFALFLALLVASSASGSHRGSDEHEALEDRTWHVQVFAYLPGVDVMFLVVAPSANGALASFAEGRAPEPVASADAALAPEDVEPEAHAAVAGAPGRVADEQARVVGLAATLVTPDEFAALASDLQGGAPVDAAASFAWAKLGRALDVARDAGTAPEDSSLMCWVVCLATDASRCPTNGLPP